MPLYEIQHTTPLSEPQREALAKVITKIHTRAFTVPSLLVNVRFIDTTSLAHYVAGKQRKPNLIVASVRNNASRTVAQFDQVSASVIQAWEAIVGSSSDTELRGIIFEGSVIAGSEAGFPIPKAGEDKLWVKKHYAEFKKMAENGDEDALGLMEEIEEREDLRDVLTN